MWGTRSGWVPRVKNDKLTLKLTRKALTEPLPANSYYCCPWDVRVAARVGWLVHGRGEVRVVVQTLPLALGIGHLFRNLGIVLINVAPLSWGSVSGGRGAGTSRLGWIATLPEVGTRRQSRKVCRG